MASDMATAMMMVEKKKVLIKNQQTMSCDGIQY